MTSWETERADPPGGEVGRRSAGAGCEERQVAVTQTGNERLDEARNIISRQPERSDAHVVVPEGEDDQAVGVMPRDAEGPALTARIEVDIAARGERRDRRHVGHRRTACPGLSPV